jgi:hypothetical protein
LDDTVSIESFFSFFSKITEACEESKLTIIILNSHLGNRKKSVSSNNSNTTLNKNELEVMNCDNKEPGKLTTNANNCIIDTNTITSKISKLYSLLKIYKVVSLYLNDYTEISMSNPIFSNFIGYLLVNKIKVVDHRKKPNASNNISLTNADPLLDSMTKNSSINTKDTYKDNIITRSKYKHHKRNYSLMG